MYTDRRIPEELKKDKVLWNEGLTGALYLEDFRRIMKKVGFTDYRVMKQSVITIGNKEMLN
jgi:arsenite methyltransferase